MKIEDKKPEILLSKEKFGENSEGDEKETTGSNSDMWDLDTNLVVKKKKSKENEVKSVVAEEQKVLLKPGQLCDYSDSDDDEDEE